MVVVAYLVLLFLLINQLVLAQPGFVNIHSCATSEYTDPLTNITYKTDGYLFNNIGTCTGFSLQSSRFFSKDSHHRWCYNLPVIKGQNYIVRFTFLNISSLKEVDFKISIDTTTIARISSCSGSVVEGAFIATRNYTNLCLLKGSGNAYISKIELRPLYDSSYLAGNTSLLIKLIGRVDLGNKDFVYRYPTDSADRIWSTDPNSSKSNLKSDNIFHRNANISIPLEILQTASSDNEKLQFIQSIHNENDTKSFDDYLIILHLFELNSNVKPGERVFDIYLNGEKKFEKIDILQIGGGSKYRDIVMKINANRYVNISLAKVSGSKYGPVCNAYEIFKVYQKATKTKQLDLDALSKLGEQLVVENPENVMFEKLHGDPCMVPPWKGLACKEKNGEFVITKLDFTLMKIHGPLPSAIDDLADLESIRCNPNISCQLPNGLSYSNAITIETAGAPPEPESNHHVIGTVAGGSVALSIALGMIFTCFYKCSRPNRKEPPIMKNVVFTESSLRSSSMTPSIKSFTLHALEKATCHYSTLIGEGGFGAVYRGTLPNDEEVAVKVRSATSTQGSREFNNEVTLLSEIRHDNLVPLLGYCSEKDQQILVYPFMSNGSLQDRLYGEASKRKVLDWATRLSIALDAAKGLAYLHSFGGRCIIHRDVKSSNILLDQSMSGKVADFGFSKYAPQEGDSAVSLEVRGTAGYLDPEYYSTQQLSAKSDVFSFGVVLLEIITGREPLNIQRPREEWSLVEWAKPYIRESKIEEIVDPNIKGTYHSEAMWRAVEAALACIEQFSTYRPNMVDIVRELEDALIIENNASEYMRSIESFGGSNRYLSIERKITADTSSQNYCEIPRIVPR